MALLPRGFTYDKGALLHDGASAIIADGAGQVGGSAKILDIGAAAMFGVVVVDVSACDVSSNDEGYTLHVQGSNDASMTTGKIGLAAGFLGADAALLGDAARSTGRLLIPFINVGSDGTIYRYVRLYADVAGTTPSITFTAFIAPDAT